MSQLLALGCSHTAGVGIDPDRVYVKLLAQHLGLGLANLAVPNGNYQELQRNLISYLKSQTPVLIIAQWPNPFRITTWNRNQKQLENITNCGDIFQRMLRQSARNFLEPWTQSIIICNMLCQAKQISVINILLESVDQYIHHCLNDFDIVLHQDDKIPGQTWFFDSSASDGLHHSAKCHALWTERLIKIINENTSQ